MSGPRRLGTLLGGWNASARSQRTTLTDDASAGAIATAWQEAVGPEIARRSRPAKLAGGVLTVLTASSAWSAELTFLAPRIIEALRRAVPEARLRRLRFSVASGRTRLLLEGARYGSDDRVTRRSHPGHTGAASPTPARAEEPVSLSVERLAAAQRTLDEWRDRAGWQTCATCGKRFEPRAVLEQECAVCAASRRRAQDARIERVLLEAPWFSLRQVRETLPEAKAPAYRRTRQRLLTRWQTELVWAERRLRRSALTAHDRVTAWSYLMLLAQMPERDIGRAVARDVLGQAWTDALFAQSTHDGEEAHARTRENHS
ncbi:MAG TPA: DUF721 domain-containing protein [Candidatus Acidoferrales bacterium]|nr:DUF721 domain-containing protein [Candidatus Acidoferrales bacterium]